MSLEMEPLATYLLEEIASFEEDCQSEGTTQKVADTWMESAYFTCCDLQKGTEVGSVSIFCDIQTLDDPCVLRRHEDVLFLKCRTLVADLNCQSTFLMRSCAFLCPRPAEWNACFISLLPPVAIMLNNCCWCISLKIMQEAEEHIENTIEIVSVIFNFRLSALASRLQKQVFNKLMLDASLKIPGVICYSCACFAVAMGFKRAWG